MTSNIDACIFLPGQIANGSEDIRAPLLAIDQLERLINIYRDSRYSSAFFPYVDEALVLIRSKFMCSKTPFVNKWVKILNNCEYKLIDQILCVLLLKYGWDIPDNIIERCKMYAEHIVSPNTERSSSYYRSGTKFSHPDVDAGDFEMSRILYQLEHKNCTDHLVYLAEYCIGVVQSITKLDSGNIFTMLTDPYNIPSKLKLYSDCVKTIVNMCILSSYIGMTIKVPDSILNSNVFRACLLQQPVELLNYFCGDMSVLDRFTLGIGKKLPDYDDKKLLAMLMDKMLQEKHTSITLPMIGIPEMHKQPKLGVYSRAVLGVNPSASDYSNLFEKDGGSILPQIWYSAALAASTNLESINRAAVLKSLVAMWRTAAGSGYNRVPIGYIAEVAKRVNASIDDVLGSSFTLKMSNVGWALKEMPELYKMGTKIGPLTTHMISIYVIKHAQKAQTVTGLQQMVEAINGNK